MKSLIFIIMLLLSTSALFACGDNEHYEITYIEGHSEVVMICSIDDTNQSVYIKNLEEESTKRIIHCDTIKDIYIENDWKNKVMYLGAAGASVGALGVVAIPAGALLGGIIGWGVWAVNEITNESIKMDFCVKKI